MFVGTAKSEYYADAEAGPTANADAALKAVRFTTLGNAG